jgi:hypothetical protein
MPRMLVPAVCCFLQQLRQATRAKRRWWVQDPQLITQQPAILRMLYLCMLFTVHVLTRIAGCLRCTQVVLRSVWLGAGHYRASWCLAIHVCYSRCTRQPSEAGLCAHGLKKGGCPGVCAVYS